VVLDRGNLGADPGMTPEAKHEIDDGLSQGVAEGKAMIWLLLSVVACVGTGVVLLVRSANFENWDL